MAIVVGLDVHRAQITYDAVNAAHQPSCRRAPARTRAPR